MPVRRCLFGATLALAGGIAWADGLPVSTNIGDIAKQAIEATGPVMAELSGAFAEKIADTIHVPDARIVVTAKAVGSLARPGCKRVLVIVEAPDTALKLANGKTAPYHLEVTLNLCADGTPPPEPGDAGEPIQQSGR